MPQNDSPDLACLAQFALLVQRPDSLLLERGPPGRSLLSYRAFAGEPRRNTSSEQPILAAMGLIGADRKPNSW